MAERKLAALDLFRGRRAMPSPLCSTHFGSETPKCFSPTIPPTPGGRNAKVAPIGRKPCKDFLERERGHERSLSLGPSSGSTQVSPISPAFRALPLEESRFSMPSIPSSLNVLEQAGLAPDESDLLSKDKKRDYLMGLRARLLDHCLNPKAKLLPPSEIGSIISKASDILAAEPNVVEVANAYDVVHVIGDIHGQFHDLCHVLDIVAAPRENGPTLVFAGDYVDRGSWGLEVFTLLLAYKVAYPEKIILLRGNHETSMCAEAYGFLREATIKCGPIVASEFVNLYPMLPIAALIHRDILVVHGGPWRSAMSVGEDRPTPGTLDDLRARSRVRGDPCGGDTILTDALWSDPAPGGWAQLNVTRGGGLHFGTDFTREFLLLNGLKLVIRAHEGPDARYQRPGMPSMASGFSIDHVIPGVGKLVTVFSAPDYPQFRPVALAGVLGKTYGAFATLQPPKFEEVSFTQYSLSTRPRGKCFL